MAVNSVHPKLFPSLYELRKLKKHFLPENIETTAKVNLQDMLNDTAASILQLSNITENTEATLTCNWGLDGSAGHSTYKQKFSNPLFTDEYLFFIAFCPLKLVENTSGQKIWENPRPGSTLYCRPIKFIFSKETKDLVKNEEAEIQSQIDVLLPYNNVAENHKIKVSYIMLLTMIDGIICNTLTDTSAASKCFICGATPKQMNTEVGIQKLPKVENYRFGLSSLHLWIRCFECLLHISYKLPFKCWQVRSENKETFETRKKEIQASFKQKMGLLVDKPKPGFGSTNGGNTARKFFNNPEISSKITGIDVDLINNFSLILRVVASGKEINNSSFRHLLQITRQQYLSLYSWYYMPRSVHKLLVHGADIISYFDLPIGLLTEEALEARHKEIQKHRLHHT